MAGPDASEVRALPAWLRVVHLAFIALLLFQCAYSSWQFFVVMRPPDSSALMLFGQARELDADFLLIRRLYAIEGWIALGVLGLYLAITEILPRRLAR